jgi:hypothetical protein
MSTRPEMVHILPLEVHHHYVGVYSEAHSITISTRIEIVHIIHQKEIH